MISAHGTSLQPTILLRSDARYVASDVQPPRRLVSHVCSQAADGAGLWMFLLAGQSNMAGRGPLGEPCPSQSAPPDP